MRRIIANLTPTLGRQDHTLSSYECRAYVYAQRSSIAARISFRDVRETPLLLTRDTRMEPVFRAKNQRRKLRQINPTGKSPEMLSRGI